MCGPMSTYCTAGYLLVDLSPVSLFIWTSHTYAVLLDLLESQQKVVEELARTPLHSGWVYKESNSTVLLTPSIIQRCLLTGVNKTKLLFIIQWVEVNNRNESDNIEKN